jgi:ketosteroid isomerase-like protein
MNLRDTLEQYHRAVDEFSRGLGEPVKRLFSNQGDVTLANPFGPPVRGWTKVSEALDYASARFTDGVVSRFEPISEYVGEDLATILEIEHWKARVGNRPDIAPFVLRVTTTFRREGGDWKIVHRHADPISTPDDAGPLRAS